MPVKIENRSTVVIADLEAQIEKVLDCVPVEHLRGFGRLRVVDRIEDPRLPRAQTEMLPILYHPRIPGTPSAFGEIALAVVFPAESFLKRMVRKANRKPIVAELVLTIVAQHYLFTLTSRKKKGGEIERAAREYVQKYFKVWRDRQSGLRARIFKPFVPMIERWQKSLRRAEASRRKKAAS
jgi:hypothetical protein